MRQTAPNPARKRRRQRIMAISALVVTGAAGLTFTACSPIYVIKAGIAEARILAARRPIPEVVEDPTTDEETRGKLVLAFEARTFAMNELALDVGKSYTSYTKLDKDTLALVLSAAHRDRLESKTWWFPIIGRVPYRGYFSEDDALDAQRDLEEDGFDTYLRPTAAFSTLGWFADPLLSTVVRYDHVELVETILHELSHNHLFVGGQVRFNESFANFVGRVGAIEFFCGRDGGGPDTLWCLRAEARWRDYQRFSRFIDGLVEDLQALYTATDLSAEEKIAARDGVFETHRERYRLEFQDTFESLDFSGFVAQPLNNATLLSRMLYYHRLPDFQAFYQAEGENLRRAVATLVARVEEEDDPWEALRPGG